MGKGLKYGLLGAVLGIATVGLAPFEVKKDDEGNFTYKSLLVGVTKGADENGEASTKVTFFNKPDMEKISATAGKVTEKVGSVVSTVSEKVVETAGKVTEKFRKDDSDTVTLEFCDDDDAAEAVAEDVIETPAEE